MLGFSFSEIALILVIAILVIDPKDLPAIARTLHKWWRELREVTDEIRAGVTEIVQESGVEDIKGEMMQDTLHTRDTPKYIEDLNGNMQRVYDISELMNKNKTSSRDLIAGSREMDPDLAIKSQNDDKS